MRDFIHMYFWQIENSNQGYLVVVVPCVVSSSIWDHLKNKQQESFLDIPDVPNGSPETCSTCQLVYDLTNLNLVFYVPKYFFVKSFSRNFSWNWFHEKNFSLGKRCIVFFFFILGWRTLVHSCWYNNLTWYTSCKYIKRKIGLVIFILIFFRQKTLFFSWNYLPHFVKRLPEDP